MEGGVYSAGVECRGFDERQVVFLGKPHGILSRNRANMPETHKEDKPGADWQERMQMIEKQMARLTIE
eukprot:10012-Eustigmatos_ZCMA.PRE.1